MLDKSTAFAFATGIALSGCATAPIYTAQNGSPPPLLDPGKQRECTVIRDEIAQEQRTAELSGIMASALVEASVRLNAFNVVTGLESRAALEGCGESRRR
jgi:hypothetical protein